LVDIGFLRELSANGVQLGPPHRPGAGTIDMSSLNIQNATFPSTLAQNIDEPSRESNLDDQDRAIQISYFDLDFILA
jgi:hypothetical protein